MRRILTSAIVGAVFAGAAFAQTPAFEPQWVDGLAVPQGAYPREALERRRRGDVSLCCPVDDFGRLACQVTAQSPARAAFGEAGVRASRWLELREESVGALRVHGRDVALRIRFEVLEGRPDLDTSRGFQVLTRSFTPRVEVTYEGLCTATGPAQTPSLLERAG